MQLQIRIHPRKRTFGHSGRSGGTVFLQFTLARQPTVAAACRSRALLQSRCGTDTMSESGSPFIGRSCHARISVAAGRCPLRSGSAAGGRRCRWPSGPSSSSCSRRRRRRSSCAAARRAPPLAMTKEPVLRYSNAEREIGSLDGATFVWLEGARPRGCGLVLGPPPGQSIYRECTSLSKTPLVCQAAAAAPVWSPKQAGLLDQPLGRVRRQPAETKAQRLTQLRSLARRFTATCYNPRTEEPTELRLLTQPLYRYDDEKAGLLDGAIFRLRGQQRPGAAARAGSGEKGRRRRNLALFAGPHVVAEGDRSPGRQGSLDRAQLLPGSHAKTARPAPTSRAGSAFSRPPRRPLRRK